jgi:hypothetical protein
VEFESEPEVPITVIVQLVGPDEEPEFAPEPPPPHDTRIRMTAKSSTRKAVLGMTIFVPRCRRIKKNKRNDTINIALHASRRNPRLPIITCGTSGLGSIPVARSRDQEAATYPAVTPVRCLCP